MGVLLLCSVDRYHEAQIRCDGPQIASSSQRNRRTGINGFCCCDGLHVCVVRRTRCSSCSGTADSACTIACHVCSPRHGETIMGVGSWDRFLCVRYDHCYWSLVFFIQSYLTRHHVTTVRHSCTISHGILVCRGGCLHHFQCRGFGCCAWAHIWICCSGCRADCVCCTDDIPSTRQ